MNPLTGVIGEAWRMYRAHALHFIAIAFVVYLAAAILDGLLSLAGGFIVTFIGSIIGLLAAFLVQAALVKAVQDVRDGRVDLSISETLSAAIPAILPVAAAAILASIAITIGLILIIVPGLWLITIWAVIVPVIVIERATSLGAFGRSRELVRGRGWHVFGTLVLIWLIWIIADIILGLLLNALPLGLQNALSTLVAGTLVIPFVAIAVTLIYYRLVGSPAGAAPGGFAAPGGYAGPGGYAAPGGYGQPGPNPGGPPGDPGNYPGGYGQPGPDPGGPPGDPGNYPGGYGQPGPDPGGPGQPGTGPEPDTNPGGYRPT